MKSVLVTGSSGTIGTRLCERLLGDGYDVTGVDRVPNRWSGALDALTVIGDLCRPDAVGALPSSVDIVVHLAANARVHDLVLDPARAFENMQSTFRILEFCRQNAIGKLIFASSREVYGDTEGTPRRESQTHVDYCESTYTASKLSGEAMVKAYACCYDMRPVIMRFSNVYGMYDVSNRLVPLFIQRARKDRDLIVYGERKLLDFTYIDDTVAGILRCIERYDRVANMTVNVASGQATLITDVAQTIKESLGSKSRVLLRENRTGEISRFVADISAAREYLDYEPLVDIEEGLARTIAWYARCNDPDWVDGTDGPEVLATTQSGSRTAAALGPPPRWNGGGGS